MKWPKCPTELPFLAFININWLIPVFHIGKIPLSWSPSIVLILALNVIRNPNLNLTWQMCGTIAGAVSQVAKLTHHSVAAVWQAQHQQDEPSPPVDLKHLGAARFWVRALRSTGGGSSSNLRASFVVIFHLARNINTYAVITFVDIASGGIKTK